MQGKQQNVYMIEHTHAEQAYPREEPYPQATSI